MDHTLIIARSMGIPAVIGLGEAVLRVRAGEGMRVDGSTGEVECGAHPSKGARPKPAVVVPRGVATTLDGHEVEIMANVSSLRSGELARDAGACGVGLVRTEFLFGGATAVPSEEEQVRCYRAIADLFPDGEVAIRLFDIGGDKPLFGLTPRTEANPALGERGVRLALRHVDALLKPQLRAILRVRTEARLKIIVPMVSGAREVEAVREVLRRCAEEVNADVARAGGVQLGSMIEVPSAALRVDSLVPGADFFSIGTNDLMQYLCAADRSLAHLGYIAEMAEPVLLRLLERVVDVARRHRRPVSLCGEWGQRASNLALLVGIGIDRVSVNPNCVSDCKAVVSKLRKSELSQMVTASESDPDLLALRSRIASRFGLA
jgi:phosphoenolpyruvate-protein kinase (PTS system EI component)